MPAELREPTRTTPPSPFPEGWYFVETRRAVEKAGLIEKTWMGVSIVAWCDDAGSVCVAESVCPHLGSELGPEAGGRICEGRLVCPSTASSSMPPASASPRPSPPPLARRAFAYSRRTRSQA